MTQDEMEEVKRHFGVVADGLRSDIRLVAEGHGVLRSEIRAVSEALSETREDLRSEIAQFRGEVQGEFRDVRAMIRLSSPSSRTASRASNENSSP
ncbi:MAG: hypothetical protein ACRD3M_16420 [Thermoanaerobaculia bacterium]